MNSSTINEIGEKIAQAGRLQTRPLCVYGSDTLPINAIRMQIIDRCIAKAIFKFAVNKKHTSIYIGENGLNSCCPGGLAWIGYISFPPMLNYFLSTGSKTYRNGAAEYLIASPELAKSRLDVHGKITPLGKFIIIRGCDDILEEENIKIKSILCFGSAEQIRNLSTLAYFSNNSSFDLIQMPMGPSCASFITYPSSMAQNGPKDCVIIGPTDPTGNFWFPKDYLSLGIPIEIAERMSRDLDNSYIKKRPAVAYPRKRTNT